MFMGGGERSEGQGQQQKGRKDCNILGFNGRLF
jgi:hypothetical protein